MGGKRVWISIIPERGEKTAAYIHRQHGGLVIHQNSIFADHLKPLLGVIDVGVSVFHVRVQLSP